MVGRNADAVLDKWKAESGIFYFIWRDNKLVLLHGFTKKTQTTPPREIQTAKTRLADYEARYGAAYS